MSLRRIPYALRALFAVVSVIAVLAYAINAWQVFGFARFVWRLPFALCFGAASVADALSLAGLFATYLLRGAKWHVRAYAWLVFFGMTALSILAAESFARWRRLPSEAKELIEHDPSLISVGPAERVLNDANVAAAAVVVALALAVHLLILAVRHSDMTERPVEVCPSAESSWARLVRWYWSKSDETLEPERIEVVEVDPPPAAALTSATVAASLPEVPKVPAPVGPSARSRKRPAGQRRPRVDRGDIARRILAGQLTYEAAMVEGHVKSRRAVEMWVASYRERHAFNAAVTGWASGATPAPVDLVPINGYDRAAEGVSS